MYLLLVADPADLVPVEVDAEETVVGADGDAVAVDEAGGHGVLDHGDGVVEHLAAPEHRLVRQLVLLQDPDRWGWWLDDDAWLEACSIEHKEVI